MTPCACCFACALCALSCGAVVRPAAVFRGSAEPPVVDAPSVTESPVLSPDHELIGRVGADCTLPGAERAYDGEWLSDVDCSSERLVQALRESAADAGGTLLVGRECNSRRGAYGTSIRCSADVARSSGGALAPRPAVNKAPGDAARASEAWAIRVHFTPSAAPPRPALRADRVHELASLPVSHVRLGDIVTECERGCTRAGALDAVRVVAGRVGATDVVAIDCAARARGWTCSGHAAGYEVDPSTDPAAR